MTTKPNFRFILIAWNFRSKIRTDQTVEKCSKLAIHRVSTLPTPILHRIHSFVQIDSFNSIFTEIGVGLAGFGIAFVILGVLLLFDKGLLAIGNVRNHHPAIKVMCHKTFATFSILFVFQILFICGLACVIGLERTFRFFFQRKKVKASIAFFGGIVIVLVGWPLVGMIIESYGFFLLFRWAEAHRLKANHSLNVFLFSFFCSGFFPVAVNFLRRVPILGRFLNLPGISGVSEWTSPRTFHYKTDPMNDKIMLYISFRR